LRPRTSLSLSRRNKARAAVSVLVFLALWPLAHKALVSEYGTNPWKLFGWAMYCVPNFKSELQFLATPKGKDDRAPRLIPFPKHFEGAEPILRAYKVEELGLGRLASTDGLAGLLFEAHPAIGRLFVRRAIRRFDVETAMPFFEYDITVHDRP